MVRSVIRPAVKKEDNRYFKASGQLMPTFLYEGRFWFGKKKKKKPLHFLQVPSEVNHAFNGTSGNFILLRKLIYMQGMY